MPSTMNIHLHRRAYENSNVMWVFCKHPTPVQIIRTTRRDDTLICACHQRASTAIVAENYRLSAEAVFIISHLNSWTLPGGDWKGHSLPWILCHFMWERKYIIVVPVALRCHGECAELLYCFSRQFACHLTSQRHGILRSPSAVDRMSRHLHSLLMAAFFDPTRAA